MRFGDALYDVCLKDFIFSSGSSDKEFGTDIFPLLEYLGAGVLDVAINQRKVLNI